ncbi:ribonuclease [Shinella curvata]|uniref:Ribonuclease n=1 Tax=Shinella curvata TaxID=1817964 RepID=A0ABT8X7C6_9HYPH|nr:ribonuclease [Shinella curvata]MCJ8052412.1 ribonuclease [Shinella curvata]MDO6119639.1 ribonuclease [Shinella curvata]
MMTNAALPFKAVLSSVLLCFACLVGPLPAAAQSVPAPVVMREVLSVSWQPGYCAARPKSRGCADFAATSTAAKQFSLLSRFQARKSYCGIDAAIRQKARKGKWTDLPDIALASGTKDRLLAAMPAAKFGLDRQQWLRSGSCVAASAEAYYSRSLDLLDQLNASPVRTLFTGKAGAVVTLTEVRAAFDTAFGPDAGTRVRLACRKGPDGQPIVIGLTIGLGTGEGKLETLIDGSSPTRSRCTEGTTGAAKSG